MNARNVRTSAFRADEHSPPGSFVFDLGRRHRGDDIAVELRGPQGESSHAAVRISEGCARFTVNNSGYPIDAIRISGGKRLGESTLFVADGLFINNDKSYEKSFIRRVQRHQNAAIDFLVADQIARYFEGSECHRVSSSVVMAYKAVEIGNPSFIHRALRVVGDALQLIPLISLHEHPRRNREHLYLSALCAKWHLKLAAGDFDGFLDVLKEAYDYIKSSAITNFFTPAFPASLTLQLYAMTCVLLGDRLTALDVADEVFYLFSKAVRDADPTKWVLMNELTVPLKASIESRKIAHAELPLEAESAQGWFFDSLRIKKQALSKTKERLWISYHAGISGIHEETIK